MDRDLERFDREGGYTFAPRVDAVLQGLGFDAEKARTQPLEQLSGGERGRLGLARQLVSAADVLLLDEPTNHLDLETTRWLEDYLKNTDKTILLISHDRTFLANVVSHVTVIHRRDALRASGIMQERAMKNPKIAFLLNSVVEEVLGIDKVSGVKTRNLKTGKEHVLKTDGLFVAIGYQPNTEIFKGQLQLDDRGYIRTKAETETNIAGVFAAGDVRDHKYRQAVTAAADGCKAAMDADRFLSEHND